MAIVVPNWERVVASARVHPPQVIRAGLEQVLKSEPALQTLLGRSGANVMEVLLLVLEESLRDMNVDKRYFLQKLTQQNGLAKGLAEYLAELVDASQRLAAEEQRKGLNDVPYRCDPDEPESWLARLTVKQISIPLRSPGSTGPTNDAT